MFGVDIFCFGLKNGIEKVIVFATNCTYVSLYKEVLHHEWVYFDLSLGLLK